MINVLHVINSLGTGGAERSTAELIAPLAERGVTIHLATLEARREGIAHESLIEPHLIRSTNVLGRAREVARLRRELSADITQSTLFEADLVTRVARARNRSPLVCSLVNTTYDPLRLQLDPNLRAGRVRVGQLLDRASGHAVTQFHAISDAVKRSAQEHLAIRGDRITVVPRGRDAQRLGSASQARRQRVRAALGLGDEPMVLSVGRQEFQKGQRFLVEAAALVREGVPDLQVIVAGREGSATTELRRVAAELSLDDVVSFLGHRPDVPDLLSAADVFVFPSTHEGLGGALLEAMALGVPSVVSDIPVLREVAGTTAIFVPVADKHRLAAAIEALLSDPRRGAELGRHASERFRDRFSLDASADGMAELYQAVLQR